MTDSQYEEDDMMKTARRIAGALLALLLIPVMPLRGDSAVDRDAIFARLKKLEGTWAGKSTNGWKARITIETIAGGSAIVETAHFEAHPGETMVTVIHPDGDRLLLTHYCASKTQPRLVASSWDENRSAVTFTFLDGTNMKSREHGHMDKAVIRFIDDDHFASRWTWYQRGEEKWMEDITYERVPSNE